MAEPHRINDERRHVTFHARVAGVALITAVAVLMAACLTFMLQQWVVAREQSRATHTALAQIIAESAAPSLAAHDGDSASAALSVLGHAPRVVTASLNDPSGDVVARYARRNTAIAPQEGLKLSVPVLLRGDRLGDVVLTFEPPSLGAMAPQFIALTAALFFGGAGLALFLSQGLAKAVIAPVQSLSEAMHEVAASGRFAPIQITAQDALFRSLAESFNHLLSMLAARDRDLSQTLQELVEARDAANTANVLKSQFLANMSHEIRTPLNGVLAMAEVMAMGDLSAAQRDRLDVIRQSGGLLLSVLNDVLDLSKIEAGKLTLTDEAFDLDQVMASVGESWVVMAKAKGLDFRLSVQGQAQGWWRGDSDRIRQILGNLISNAVKFTAEGEVRVLADLVPESGALRLTVTDTGVGIPADKLPNLFEKFTQADNSATRRFGGTGLGLAICRELTQMMGGQVKVSSQVGDGSAFEVVLPLARAEAPEAAAKANDEAETDLGTMRILAAEDNPTNQQVLAAVMGALGIEVEIVPDGRAAFEAWRDGTYDLILMDIQMPVMDGIDSARAIRRAEADLDRRRIPILALTANALSHQIEEYMAVGMDGHVSKPIEIPRLYEAIGHALTGAARDEAAVA